MEEGWRLFAFGGQSVVGLIDSTAAVDLRQVTEVKAGSQLTFPTNRHKDGKSDGDRWYV